MQEGREFYEKMEKRIDILKNDIDGYCAARGIERSDRKQVRQLWLSAQSCLNLTNSLLLSSPPQHLTFERAIKGDAELAAKMANEQMGQTHVRSSEGPSSAPVPKPTSMGSSDIAPPPPAYPGPPAAGSAPPPQGGAPPPYFAYYGGPYGQPPPAGYGYYGAPPPGYYQRGGGGGGSV